jgi:hypothetical protein
LKDINQLDIQDASALLDQFVKSQPAGRFAWIAELKPIAQKYLDDCQVYLAWKADPAKTGSTSDLKKQLKTRSAIADAITGQARQSSSSAAAPSQPVRPLTQAESAAAAQKKSQWLAAWKKRLIDELNHKQFTGALTDIGGVEYTGVSSADKETIGLKLPYGIARMPWSKLPSKTLLNISTSFIQPNAPDAADRQWLCAVYANATGQSDAARQLAEAAAESKPEYREQLRSLFPQ